MNAVHRELISQKSGRPHPRLFDLLFSHKHHTLRVFNDVLGLCGIDHVAITYINPQHEILTLSSTPALEFNLFKSPFWRFDQTYHATWYRQCIGATWDTLSMKPHQDVLYYLKQIKPGYRFGFSRARSYTHGQIIYSLATRGQTLLSGEVFEQELAHFDKIGHYCTQALLPLLLDWARDSIAPHFVYNSLVDAS